MTGKRFGYEECYITFDGEVFAIAENKKNAKVIGETLIQLSDENENLKKVISGIFDTIIELDFAKEEYCGALFRLLNEENNDIDKVKKRIEDFLEL